MEQVALNKTPDQIYAFVKEFRDMLDHVSSLVSQINGGPQFDEPIEKFKTARDTAMEASKSVDVIMEAYEGGFIDGHLAAEQANIRLKRIADCKQQMLNAIEEVRIINATSLLVKKGGRRGY